MNAVKSEITAPRVVTLAVVAASLLAARSLYKKPKFVRTRGWWLDDRF